MLTDCPAAQVAPLPADFDDEAHSAILSLMGISDEYPCGSEPTKTLSKMQETREAFFGHTWNEDAQTYEKAGEPFTPNFPGSLDNPCVCTDCRRQVYIGDMRDPAELRGLWLLHPNSPPTDDDKRLNPTPKSHPGRHHFRCASTVSPFPVSPFPSRSPLAPLHPDPQLQVLSLSSSRCHHLRPRCPNRTCRQTAALRDGARCASSGATRCGGAAEVAVSVV